MPHYRKLWRKFTTSEDVNDMPDDTMRLAWALLPHALDREGRGLDNAAWLRAQIFPLREDVTIKRVREMLDWWGERGMIIRYEVNAKACFVCPTFHAHQGDCSREATSELPAPTHDLLMTNSRLTHDLLMTNSGTVAAAVADAEAKADAEADAVAVASIGDADAAAVIAALAAAGIGEPTRTELAALPFMSPAYIEQKRRETTQARGDVGLLVVKLRDGPHRNKRKGGNGNGKKPEDETTEDRKRRFLSPGVEW